MKSKKAMEISAVTQIILVIVGAIVLFAAVAVIYSGFQTKSGVEVCRLSVAAQASSKVVPSLNGMKSPFNVECDKRYINFFKDHVELGFSPDKTKPIDVLYNGNTAKKIPQLNSYVVNQVIAEEMRMCFYEFGEGKLDVFDTSITANGIKGIFYGTDVCFVCSEIHFKDTTPVETFVGFIDYLNRTKIKSTEMTYYEYFDQQGLSQLKWSLFRSTIDPDPVFKTNEDYAVVFMKQDKRLTQIGKDFLIGEVFPPYQVYNVIGTLFTDKNIANNNYYTYVVPTTQLNKLCDTQAN